MWLAQIWIIMMEKKWHVTLMKFVKSKVYLLIYCSSTETAASALANFFGPPCIIHEQKNTDLIWQNRDDRLAFGCSLWHRSTARNTSLSVIVTVRSRRVTDGYSDNCSLHYSPTSMSIDCRLVLNSSDFLTLAPDPGNPTNTSTCLGRITYRR